ncbi:unknown [Sutterella sp. CAG:351]|nr:unknown [Sutterella sp. CAG:351]
MVGKTLFTCNETVTSRHPGVILAYMDKFMHQRKGLSRESVFAIYENKGRVIVRQSESTKLIRIKRSSCIYTNNPATHYTYTQRFYFSSKRRNKRATTIRFFSQISNRKCLRDKLGSFLRVVIIEKAPNKTIGFTETVF